MSMANAFSGGLFLAIALIHILPDIVKDWDEYNKEKNMPRSEGPTSEERFRERLR